MVYDKKLLVRQFTLQAITTRPPLVIAALGTLTIVAFLGVTRMVNRFTEEQKAVARHLYAQGLTEQQSGKADLAIEHYRAALSYAHDNFDYQLQLARALRDTGRTEEAEAYLVNLWERSPQSGVINLALGRLAARENSLDKVLQYYHNAIYGVWATPNPDESRLSAWFELVDTLLRKNARSQAQAELISLSAELRNRPDLELRIADLFGRAGDYEHGLGEYQRVLAQEPENTSALAGAGQDAFHLGRYRDAAHYLQRAVKANPEDSQSAQLLDLSNMIFESDPFIRRLSSSERLRRVKAAFEQAGSHLDDCARTKNLDLKSAESSGSPLAALESHWLELKPKVTRLRTPDSDLENSAMDLVFQIEQEAERECGSPVGLDQALLLLAQNPGVEF